MPSASPRPAPVPQVGTIYTAPDGSRRVVLLVEYWYGNVQVRWRVASAAGAPGEWDSTVMFNRWLRGEERHIPSV